MILNIFHWVKQTQRILKLQSVDYCPFMVETLRDRNSLGGEDSTDKLNKGTDGRKKEHHENHRRQMHFRTETARNVEVVDEFRDCGRDE